MQARAIALDHGLVSATATSGNGGNIHLQVPESLLLRHGSKISATAGTANGGGNGGNIYNDNTGLVVAFPTEDSDISANAFSGNGGQVKLNASGIFGIRPQPADTPQSDITASSTGGGINTVTIVPATGWVFNGKGEVTLTAAVPSDPIQVPWLTPASCNAQ